MQTLPALLPPRPSLQHLRWVNRLRTGRTQSATIRLAQSVALSGTASIIVVAVQHCVIGPAVPPSYTEVTKQSVAMAEAAVQPQPELPAPATVAVVMTAPAVRNADPAPSMHPLLVPAGRDLGHTRPAESWVPLPPRLPIRAAADDGVVALAAPIRNAVTPESAKSGLATAPRLVRAASAVPLPPSRATLAQARPPINEAPRNVVPPVRTAAGAHVTSGRPIVLAAATVPATLPYSHQQSDDAQILVAPVHYGMGLALGVGKFVIATNNRLISGATDAIGSLVR